MDLVVEIDPVELGFDPARLGRIDRRLQRYVDEGLLPGWMVVVARDGELAHVSMSGHRDVEAGLPVTADTVWRIYSMTKPITTVAALSLWEEGAFELNDPVHRYLPEFRDTRVWRSGSVNAPVTDPTTETMRVWHLMSHMSGLTYGFLWAHPVDELYRRAGFEWGTPSGLDLAGVTERLASLPLLFQPGREWNYSMATDVLGRLVEVVAGAPLDQALRDRVLDPLGMSETAFHAGPAQLDRLAALYAPHPETKRIVRFDAMGDAARRPPDAFLGGGGLVSTAGDYLRFAEMLRRGGELDGVRILSPRTVEYLASNHLPGDTDLSTIGRPLFAETTFDGVGFGLGVSVTIDPVAAKVPGSPGDFGWGGAASTWFMVDPVEDLTVMLFTQLLPSSTHPLRSQMKQLVHQALVD
ncbi:MAG: beta-lactamase family protein [Ilumatobacteraceae bacterium]|jgi:CubicO group peptidase (beta-lactamase class C family)|nr:beta-lactamase family protein [Ilumatobacteraceae bacterium]